jgi:arabinan endo-1,5-alpha-L-arabinosidase
MGSAWAASVLGTPAAPPHLRGDLGIHDPSTIVQCKDRFYVFGTGDNIISKSSSDKVVWKAGPTVFSSPPAWTQAAVPGFVNTFWAPDIIYLNGEYRLYYSVSTWGKQVSAIGLVTNPTLDPADPTYQWTDRGPVIQSQEGSPYNTIDPSVVLDGAGNPWLAFGSYWNGIYLVQLDLATGLRISSNSPTYRLAYNGSIEASGLLRRGGFYYLFVNWGSCCSGVNSTYQIRVGRSTSITGPYLDRNGVDLVNRGGTLFLEGTGKYVGPGHAAFLEQDGQTWFSYHYYDANAYASWYGAYGQAKFDLQPLSWTPDLWPVFTNDWSAVYDFDTDARDERGQYYGLLEGGATVVTDPARGRVLNLNGAGQYVRLPPGVAYARTFAAVIKWNGGGAWQRIFDFGNDTSSYVMLTPSSGNGRLRCDIRANGTTQILETTSAVPVGVWTHVAVTLDGSRGVLYLNGAPVATNTVMNLSPLDVRAQTNHLGRSKFSADPDFNGQIAQFRVHGRALSAAEIAAPQPRIVRPAEGTAWWPGGSVVLQGSATDFNELPLGPGALTWRIEMVDNGTTNIVVGPLSGISEGVFSLPSNVSTSAVCRVALTVTNSAGRTQTAFVHLTRGTSTTEWGSFYPFTTGGLDASNRHHATLIGGASVQTDPVRGSVLNLSGAGQYASLPGGVGTFRTFAAWVKWNGGGAWQRIFDFGSDTSRWIMLTAANSDGRLEAAITTDRPNYVQVVRSPGGLPVGVWVHVAVTFDGRQAILYTNGVAVAVNHSANLLPSDIATPRAYFGRSQYAADPYFNGRLDSVRLGSRALSAAELFGPQPVIFQPAVGATYSGGAVVSYSGAAYDYADSPLGPSAFAWSGELHQDGLSHPAFGPISGVTNGAFQVPTTGSATTNAFYRLKLQTTDSQGNQQTVWRDVAPQIAHVELASVPAGLEIKLDGQAWTTPAVIPAVAGFSRTLEAPSPQSLGGSNYTFVLWSDGGAGSHVITIPSGNTTYTASFVPPSVTLNASGGQLTLSWPAWASPLVLHQTTNLTPPVAWTPVTNTPAIWNDSLWLTLPAVEEKTFFRLQTP